MTPEVYRRVNEIVERALDRDGEERSRFIADSCQGDTQLQSEVERLLARAAMSITIDVPPLPRVPAATDELPAQVGRYRLEGEIARGGMGLVLRVHDEDFDRPLAMKVLLDSVRGQGDFEERFVREARLTGVLQHPGIPPVHALGRLPDGRPYFVMKLIQGRSLHEILKERSSPSANLPHLVGIFGQICQTLGYAHARGVIHRDLKPANIMVGAFGEVQVMDWGLAKVLGTNEAKPEEPGGTMLGLRRTMAAAGATTADSVMGTPAYMAPEQAHGDVDRMDARTDVFGLGAILCEILTGAPPYRGRDRREIFLRATQVDLGDALARLTSCGADPELTELVRRCLAPRQEDRLADGSAVAAAVAAYQAELERRLRQAELDHAAAAARAEEETKRRQVEQAKALEERKRRRLAVALAATLVLMVTGGSLAWLGYQNEKTRRQAEQTRQKAELDLRREYVNKQVKAALEDVSTQRNALHEKLEDPLQVHDLLSDIDQWQTRLQAARAAWLRAESLAKGDEKLLDHDLARQFREQETALTADEQDWVVAKELDDIRGLASRLMEGTRLNFTSTNKDYAEVFARVGLALGKDEPAIVAQAISRVPLRYVLVAALDHWAQVAPDDQLRGQILETARQADPNPWRDRFRDVKVWNDPAALELLARDLQPEEHSAQVLIALIRRLPDQSGASANILRRAILYRPRDFWLHSELGYVVKDLTQQAGCFQTALAIRPQDALTHSNLGVALRRKGDLEGAIMHCNRAIKINPKLAGPYNTRGIALREQKHLEQAIADFRTSIDLAPAYAYAYGNLGDTLLEDDRTVEAVSVYRRALKLEPDPKFSSACYRGIGVALYQDNRATDAIAAYRMAISLDPKDVAARYLLGSLFYDLQRFPDAINAFQKVVVLDPKFADAYNCLGNSLEVSASRGAAGVAGDKRLEEAVAAYQKALELDPKGVFACNGLGNAFRDLKRPNEAVAAYQKAIELDPKYALAHNGLGNAFRDLKRPNDAIAVYRTAIDLDPKYVSPRNNLGITLLEQGSFAEAAECTQTLLGLLPEGHPLRGVANIRLKEAQRLLALEKRLPAVLEGKDKASAADLLELAKMCRQYGKEKRYATVVRLYQVAFKSQPELAEQHRHDAACAAILAGCGHGEEGGNLAAGEKAKLRRQGRAWLREELNLCAKQAQTEQARPVLQAMSRLRAWQREAELAGVRDASDLARLPDEELKAWQKLWQDVQRTLKDAAGRFSETRLQGTLTREVKTREHKLKMSAGKTYVLDMESTAFLPFLGLVNAQNRLLASNNSITSVDGDARIVYIPTEDGVYRLVATSFQERGLGDYPLTIREFRATKR